MRMDAYYYSFDKTGNEKIDRILSAVACAGKAYHHTDSWNDDCYTPEGHVGNNPIDWIQNAAKDAAAEVRALVEAAEEAILWLDDVCDETTEYATEPGVTFLLKFKAALAALEAEDG